MSRRSKRKQWNANNEIHRDEDGVYRWYYALNLLRNPTILFMLWKIFFWICVGMFAFMNVIELFDGGYKFKTFIETGKVFGLLLLIFFGLTTLGYFLYAAFNGFRYCVVFEMDEKGVTHTQAKSQFKSNRKLSFLAMLMGVFARNPTLVGSGLLTSTHQSMRSSWESVTSVEIIRKRNVIKVNETLFKNQVYARDEDFDFVEQFVRAHVGKDCKITG